MIEGAHGSGLEVIEVGPPTADRETIGLVHDARYIDSLERFCESGGGALDPDTVAGEATWEAALRSAAGGMEAIRRLERGEADVGFVAMRPPGHHALVSRAMGFCFFNNIAIAARSLTEDGRRVAIVDWDVHHGNGTQDLFYDDPDVFYLSFHEFPAYPGSGWLEERGSGPGRGTTLNFPFPAGTSGAPYRWAMRRLAVPTLEAFAPDWILVSCGFDAHDADPLAEMRLESSDYAYLAGQLTQVVDPNRIVFFLEGGYDLDALRTSTAATLGGVAGTADPVPDVDRRGEEGGAWRIIDHVAGRH